MFGIIKSSNMFCWCWKEIFFSVIPNPTTNICVHHARMLSLSHTHTHTHAHAHAHAHAHTHSHTHTRARTHTHTLSHAHMHVDHARLTGSIHVPVCGAQRVYVRGVGTCGSNLHIINAVSRRAAAVYAPRTLLHTVTRKAAAVCVLHARIHCNSKSR